MRFQKLTIHNLASIEDAVIDFEAQPLSDSEVFLISGATGSGKSTILDAICLALYAKTPRFANTQMDGNVSDGGKVITLGDPRQLLRRNTGEGFAKLTFEGSNGVHYEACWSVARSHNRVTGNLQSRVWELQDLDNGRMLNKMNDIEEEIRKAVGLDFKQFCRTTMLAQGEFTRFLNSGDKDKAEILEKITGMDIYAKVGKKVYDMTSKKQKDKEIAQAALDGIRPMSNEELAAKKEESDKLDAESKAYETTLNGLAAAQQWLTQEQDLRQKRDKALADWNTAKEAVGTPEMTEVAQLVERWRATIDARNWRRQRELSRANEQAERKYLTDLTHNYLRLLNGKAFGDIQLQLLTDEQARLAAFLQQEKENATVYANANVVESQLKIMDDSRAQLGKTGTELAKLQDDLDKKLTPQLAAATHEAQAADDELKQKEEALAGRKVKLAEMELDKLRQEEGSLRALNGKIEMAKQRLDNWKNELARKAKAAEDLKAKAADIALIRQALDQLPDVEQARKKMDECKARLDQQKVTIEEFTTLLRQRLKKDDICPVCGQKIMAELPKEEALNKLVEGLETEFRTAEKEYNELVGRKNELTANMQAQQKALDAAQQSYNNDRMDEAARATLLEACTSCGIAQVDEQVEAVLDEKMKANNQKIEALGAQLGEGKKMEDEIAAIDREVGQCRKAVEAKHKLKDDAQKAVEENGRNRVGVESSKKALEAQLCHAETEVRKVLEGSAWATEWTAEPQTFAQKLKSAAEQYNTQTDRKKALDGKVIIQQNTLNTVGGLLANMVKEYPAWESQKTTTPEQLDDLADKAQRTQECLNKSLGRQETAQKDIGDNDSKLQAFLAEHTGYDETVLATLDGYTPAMMGECEKQLKEAHDKVNATQSVYASAVANYNDHQAAKPAMEEGATAAGMQERQHTISEAKRQIDERLGAINQELKTNSEAETLKAEALERYNKCEAEYARWDKLNQLIGDSTGSKFRKIAQSYVLENLIHSANGYMATLSNRYTLKVVSGTFVIMVEDAYQGFVSRAASTISGGESFLVSLSLALALSDIGSRVSVDTLFIDEGFGTLSGEPLQKAIDTLRSLHTHSGRHVGIISHVEELREKIPVQIQVDQQGHSSLSKVSVVG